MKNKIKDFFTIIGNFLKCFFGKHKWRYVCGNYQTNKDIFECENCKKQIEQ